MEEVVKKASTPMPLIMTSQSMVNFLLLLASSHINGGGPHPRFFRQASHAEHTSDITSSL